LLGPENLISGAKDSLVKRTLPGYKSFSRSFSMPFDSEGGLTATSAAENAEAAPAIGFVPNDIGLVGFSENASRNGVRVPIDIGGDLAKASS
jgi:hypothetical protein